MRYRLFWLGTLGATLLAPQVTFADISGKVFRDFNANGVFDSSANFNEVGMAGVSIKAFDANGVQAGSTVSSDINGNYTLTGLLNRADYRVEFSWSGDWLKPGASGGTSVQFVNDGASDVNLGLNNPLDYSQADTNIFITTPVAIVGPADQAVATGRDYRTYPALVKFPFNATGKPADPGYIPPTSLATHQQIGSTSGVAFQRENKRLFASAYYKRAVGFGPGGVGAIYSIDDNGTVDVHATIPNAGTDTHDFTGDYTTINYDTASVPNVGKSSLGDMEISADGQWLYVINLNNRHLYAVATNTTNTVNDLGEITRPASCPDNDFRPFGLGMDETNTLYIGTVCTNESGTSATGHPSAMVLKYNGAGSFTETLNFDLFFNSQSFWKNWSDTLIAGSPFQPITSHQPMLSDIVFDGKDMVLAFRNRAWEAGYMPGGSSPSMSHILKACWNGADWTLENNGTCGGVTGALPNYSVTAEAGPGGGYFFDMRDILASFGGQSVINALGSVAIAPGRSIVATLADPNDLISGGIKHLNLANGSGSMPYQVFRGSADGSNGGGSGGYFGKTSGLGDIELLLDPAPIEIGNRVWLDTDNDGLQDAGENGIPNVQVKLFAGATELATATTAADGTYYFTNAAGTNTDSKKYGLDQLQPNTAYTVKFPTSVTVSGTTYNLTMAIAGGNTLIDSNAPASGEVTVAAADIPTAGANNHSFDVGYILPTPKMTDLEVTKTANLSSVKSGDTVIYTVKVKNNGPDTATGVEVTDQLPAGVTYVSHNADQGAYTSGTGIWTVGTLANGTTATLTITVTIK
ncbi:SdrD B-like domain-containing protein [Thiothrix unzii]|jgi:uncharacterized repeat protein (TIGR01451 family)|uniref:SdrD B-like domain-containing protein n=1 Tax=Thiothrix unzii TaxID=111769 RepID=UPI002A36C88E|nr:SdrD B-like domain-containing protein [Thiothrix unzii]MDX9988156.1 SdrD B-like domain-containing protein [Thiothrix unzii]